MRSAYLIVAFLSSSILPLYGQTPAQPRSELASQRVFPRADHPAEFPGGSDELGKYLSKRLRYPASLLKAGVYPPTITVSFIVAETGAVENVEVIKLRQEDYARLEPYIIKVVNTLEKMPHWKPATNGNMAVASRHIIPVSIDVK